MESIWFASCPIERRNPLDRDIKTDIAVIGAGMTGILTAYKLQKTGKIGGRTGGKPHRERTDRENNRKTHLSARAFLPPHDSGLGGRKSPAVCAGQRKRHRGIPRFGTGRTDRLRFRNDRRICLFPKCRNAEKRGACRPKTGDLCFFCPNASFSHRRGRCRQIPKPGAISPAQADCAARPKADYIRKHPCPLG